MKKYRLNFCDTAYIDFDEESFKKFDKCKIQVEKNRLIDGVELWAKSINWEYDIKIITPIDNLEVIYE